MRDMISIPTDLKSNKEWKLIEGFEGYYINKEGIVISTKHKKYRILSQHTDKSGYIKIDLMGKNGKKKSLLLHRLVAKNFIPNPDELPEINHKDENKSNNIDNLEWCTHKYNSNYGTRVSRIIPKTIAKTRVKICQCDENMNIIKIWDGINLASRKLNIIQQNITRACQNKRRHAGGYRWRYYGEG